MPASQVLISADKLYYETAHKIVANEIPQFDNDGVLNDSMMKTQNGDTLSMLPSCRCQYCTGVSYVGFVCPKCGTTVISPDEETGPAIWLRQLSPDIPFISPEYWTLLTNMLGNKEDWLWWLCDSRDTAPLPPTKAHIWYIHQHIMNGRKSYALLINKIPAILEYLLTSSKYKGVDEQESLTILKHMWSNPDICLSRHIPTVNKNIFVKEVKPSGNYMSFTLSNSLSIVRDWIKASNNPKVDIEWVTAKAISGISALYYDYMSKYAAKKPGIFRKNIFGWRSSFTSRGVITPITGKHAHYELHMPWAMSVSLFRLHIINKLINKHNKKLNDALYLVNSAIKTYIPIIHDILVELIAESPFKQGIPVTFQRNPSQLQGSVLFMFISRIKTDISDNTIGLPPSVAKWPNADFDGDEMNLSLLLDMKLAELAEVFNAYYSIPDVTSKPYTVASGLTLNGPSNATVREWLKHTNDDTFDELTDFLTNGG